MRFFEELPQACPEHDAIPVDCVVYRLVSASPNDSDFLSQRALYPDKSFHASECRARSLSVFTDKDDAKAISCLPAHSAKKIAAVQLSLVAGVVKQTGKNSHRSWWRSENFAATAAIKVILP